MPARSVDHRLLGALIDRIIPADDHPPASGAGVVEHLLAHADGDHAHLWDRWLGPGLAALDAEARARHGAGFVALDAARQDALLEAMEAAAVQTPWPVPPDSVLAAAVRVASEAYYGPRDAPSWSMVGYRPGPKRDPGAQVEHRRVPTLALGAAAGAYDVVVVGSGPGGATAAMVLAEAGAMVLVAERGPFLTAPEVGNDHLRNHRLPVYGLNTPPDAASGGPRVLVRPDGRERVLTRPWDPGWSAQPQTAGGGSRVYQGMAWRLLPEDFRLATRHGVPEGSSLADWPLTYDDLEPYYTRAEWDLGVAGDSTAHRNQGHRSKGYPLPPPPWNPEAEILQRGAERLGWTTGPVPLLINTEPRDGRARCVQCGECVGMACPTDAKNGAHNVSLPRAVATGRCHLATGARATRITTDERGRVTGVELIDGATGARREIRAGRVVVSCGAIESARLLLASRSDAHPSGIGNATDQVGRHLQGHLYVGAFGTFDEPVIDSAGPGVRIATCDHIHRLPGGVIGGGVLANEVTKMPVLHWYWALPPDRRRWGAEGKRAMRQLYTRTSHVMGPIQEVPHPEVRVTLAEDVRDRDGVPVARLSGRLHPANMAQAAVLQDRAVEWMEAAGAREVWRSGYSDALTAGQHAAGTCRMGTDPAGSVTDPFGRVHGHDELYVIDGSLHVTNGGVNPVLTIYALAYRCAEHLAAS